MVDSFRPGFARPESFATFQQLLAGWIVALGPRTLSAVWQATGQAGKKHWDNAYSLFASAKWNWDDLGKILGLMIVTKLLPTDHIFILVDDTLCHKRGAKVAFGGFFLDAVTSTKTKKNFRFGVNGVVVGLSVSLPFRPDRSFCLPVVWRADRKTGTPGHQTRTELAAELAKLVAQWLPDRDCWLIGDNAYLNSTVLMNRPKTLPMIGPLRWNAVLHSRPAPRVPGTKGRPKLKGDRLPSLKVMIEDATNFPAETIEMKFGVTLRQLRVQVIRQVLWWSGSKTDPVTIVLVRDEAGQWRDEVVLTTGVAVSAEFVIARDCRRWSREVVVSESNQLLGLHDPGVRTEPSVARAHPMAWFVPTLTIVWYATAGQGCPAVPRERPWDTSKPGVTFADMLSVLRLQQWDRLFSQRLGDRQNPEEFLNALKTWLAAVR